MGMNKVGIQVIGDRYDPARLKGPNGVPVVVKLVDCSAAYYWQVRGVVGPKCYILVRWVRKEQPLDNPMQNARDWFEIHRAEILEMMSDYTLFEGDNEQADSDAARYCAKELERIHLLHSVGAWAAIGNWSVGVPEIAMWAVYKPLVDACVGQDAIGLHEYCINTADIDNRWHCGRWTLVPILAGKRIVITEFNRDVVESQGHQGGVTLEDLAKYGALLEQYPNVLGVTVFQTGSIDSQWAPFEVGGWWEQVTSKYVKEVEVTPVPTATLKIDGRLMNEQQFRQHVSTLKFAGAFKPLRIFLHHTDVPTLSSWEGAKTIEAMRHTYESWGWEAGPHLFVAPEGIWLFTPLNQEGIGVSGHNPGSWHLEMVGNYDQVKPSGAVLEYTLWALKILYNRLGVDWRGLYFHRDYAAKTCPGSVVTKEWVLQQLGAVMGFSDGLPSEELATDAKTLVNKARWWVEEWVRWSEAGYGIRAHELQLSLIALMYRAENAA